MSYCFDCRHVAPLGPKPKNEYLMLQEGHWGVLARGLVYCAHKKPGQNYARFRSADSDASCPLFELELDPAKREGRRKVAKVLREKFATWSQEQRRKAR